MCDDGIERKFQRAKLILAEMCAPLHLDNDSLLVQALSLQLKIWGRDSFLKHGCYTRKMREQFCIVVWEHLNREKNPRPLPHLCDLFDVSIHRVRREIIHCKMSVTPTNPSDYISTLCQCFHLSFRTECIVKKYLCIIEQLDSLISYDTKYLLAATIILVTRIIRKYYPKQDAHFRPSQMYHELDVASKSCRKKVNKLIRKLAPTVLS